MSAFCIEITKQDAQTYYHFNLNQKAFRLKPIRILYFQTSRRFHEKQ